MKNKLRIPLLIFVLVYALSTITGAIIVISDETFHLGEWLFSGSLYPVFIVLYHLLMISGCILALSKKSKMIVLKYVLMVMALVLVVSRLVNYVINLIPLIENFQFGSPEINKVLTEALIRPGGIVAEILLMVVVFILFYGNNTKEKT